MGIHYNIIPVTTGDLNVVIATPNVLLHIIYLFVFAC